MAVTKNSCAMETSEVVENFLEALVKGDATVESIFIGITNSMAFGKLLSTANLDFDDDDLQEIHDHLEQILKIVQKIEE